MASDRRATGKALLKSSTRHCWRSRADRRGSGFLLLSGFLRPVGSIIMPVAQLDRQKGRSPTGVGTCLGSIQHRRTARRSRRRQPVKSLNHERLDPSLRREALTAW
ncbi:hypothetical protein [Oxynema aestuarii]|uniref:Uncharacterized protein n=1 Tax=Oxynema aestuarii AP17 TaxID=2064643 RepID=A0A6H1TX88_9CYAN|nr:hypothetical protein [Oxynema aestuarii]QIZ70757.1 hypothetical protein HCG48_09315 [Oxynema aestuarii AP17]